MEFLNIRLKKFSDRRKAACKAHHAIGDQCGQQKPVSSDSQAEKK